MREYIKPFLAGLIGLIVGVIMLHLYQDHLIVDAMRAQALRPLAASRSGADPSPQVTLQPAPKVAQ